MTDPEHHEQPGPDLLLAQLSLDAAVQQLIQPATETIQRATADTDPAVRDTDTEHTTRTRELRAQHTAARLRRDPAAMRRALTQLITHEQQHRARRTTTATLPSLLDQLRDAVESSSSTGGAASAGAHRSPIGLAAAELLGEIRDAARTVPSPRDDQQRPVTDLAALLRHWASHAGHWRTTDPDRLVHSAQAAERWVATGRAVLNPPRRLTAVGACLVCGRATAHVRDDAGEIVRRPALELDPTTGTARCIAPGCGAYWPAEKVPFLAAALEDQARALREQAAQSAAHPAG